MEDDMITLLWCLGNFTGSQWIDGLFLKFCCLLIKPLTVSLLFIWVTYSMTTLRYAILGPLLRAYCWFLCLISSRMETGPFQFEHPSFGIFCLSILSVANLLVISNLIFTILTVNLCHAWPRNFEIWSESSNLRGSFEHLLRGSEFRQERRSFFEDK